MSLCSTDSLNDGRNVSLPGRHAETCFEGHCCAWQYESSPLLGSFFLSFLLLVIDLLFLNTHCLLFTPCSQFNANYLHGLTPKLKNKLTFFNQVSYLQKCD